MQKGWIKGGQFWKLQEKSGVIVTQKVICCKMRIEENNSFKHAAKFYTGNMPLDLKLTLWPSFPVASRNEMETGHADFV